MKHNLYNLLPWHLNLLVVFKYFTNWQHKLVFFFALLFFVVVGECFVPFHKGKDTVDKLRTYLENALFLSIRNPHTICFFKKN
jgi:hypothetical protein